jgi:L-ascorbate metabolism protein UlaG (beta-lactamase superfamily)
MERLYLRQDIIAQPLVLRWQAWPQLLFPPTAALNVVGRHLKIMRSFVQAPQAHEAACRNPALRSGPFLDAPAARREEIRALIEETERRQRGLVELTQAMTALDRLLTDEARGRSLEPLYARVPEQLRGYVELVYDTRNRPSARFLEPLLYRGPAYDTSVQGFALFPEARDARRFMLSTPLLPQEGEVELALPFDAPAIDALVRMKYEPGSREELEARLEVPAHQRELFRTFFTPEAPPRPPPVPAGRVRIRYFGHACVLVETADTSVLVDPLLRHGAPGEESFTFSSLPARVDHVVLTHAHSDHTALETLIAIRGRTGTVHVPPGGGSLQDPGLKPMLERLGFRDVRELGMLSPQQLGPGVTLTGLPFLGEHSDLDIRAKHVVLLEALGHRMMFATDARNVEPRMFEHVHRLIGDVRMLFVGLECEGAPLSWLYGPLMPEAPERTADQGRRLNGSTSDMAMQLVRLFGVREAFVYALGLEPWLTPVTGGAHGEHSLPVVETRRFVETCRAEGIPSERLYLSKEIVL